MGYDGGLIGVGSDAIPEYSSCRRTPDHKYPECTKCGNSSMILREGLCPQCRYEELQEKATKVQNRMKYFTVMYYIGLATLNFTAGFIIGRML